MSVTDCEPVHSRSTVFRRRRILISMIVVAAVVVSGAAWWLSRRGPEEPEVLATVCNGLSTAEIEQVAGRRVESENLGRTSSFRYNPDLSCTLAFDGFAFVRIGYINAPWFWSLADTSVREDRLKTDFTSYGWSVEEIDLGLGGRSYVTVDPDRNAGDTAYGVWYSESGRTLWVAVFRDDPTVSTDEIKRTTIALLDHLADVVPPIYPTTTDEPSAPAS